MKKLLLTVLLAATQSMAGTELTLHTRQAGFFGTRNSDMKIFSEGNLIRLEMDKMTIIWDAQSQNMTYLMHEKKEYMVLTRAERLMAGRRMKDNYDQAMRAAGPQQSKALANLFKGVIKKTIDEQAKIVLKPAGSGSVLGVACNRYDTYRGAEKTGSVCLAKGPVADALFHTYDAFKAIALENPLAAEMGAGALEVAEVKARGLGVSIQSVQGKNGKESFRRELTAFQQGVPAGNKFSIPAGYQKKEVSPKSMG